MRAFLIEHAPTWFQAISVSIGLSITSRRGGTTSAAHGDSSLLLADGTSYLLLANGIDRLALAAAVGVVYVPTYHVYGF